MRMITAAATTPVATTLAYCIEEPYAVTLVFQCRGTRPITWVFARDLLVAGLTTATGDGDVRIWPAERGDPVFFELCSPTGHAVFAADRKSIRRFLAETEKLVPRGGEPAVMSMDYHLAALLGGEPGLAPPV